jgi:hypothetical protein
MCLSSMRGLFGTNELISLYSYSALLRYKDEPSPPAGVRLRHSGPRGGMPTLDSSYFLSVAMRTPAPIAAARSRGSFKS